MIVYSKCPYCNKLFLNTHKSKLYCSSIHGYSHRNSLKGCSNSNYVRTQLELIRNVKILKKFCRHQWTNLTSWEPLIKLGFDPNIVEEGPDSEAHILGEVMGYIIQFGDSSFTIHVPGVYNYHGPCKI